MLPDQELLKALAAGINLDSHCANFATHSRPQRFVAVDHNHFVRSLLQGMDLASDYHAQHGEEFGRVRQMCHFIAAGVVQVDDPIGGYLLVPQQLDALYVLQLRTYLFFYTQEKRIRRSGWRRRAEVHKIRSRRPLGGRAYRLDEILGITFHFFS